MLVRQKAFTLIEVLVASFLLLMSLSFLLRAQHELFLEAHQQLKVLRHHIQETQ